MKLTLPDIKAGYDRYLLVSVALLSGAAAAWIAISAGEARAKAQAPMQTGAKEPFAAAPAIETLKSDKAELANRKPWRESKASPFVSRVYLLKDNALIDILEAGTDLFPGIANAWILEHGLDYLDTGLPEGDPDADGFTNFEEFTAKTNPRDAASKPALWTKLRLLESKVDKLRLKFMSLPKGTLDEVAINTTTPDNPSKLSGSTQFYPRAREEVQTVHGEKEFDKKIVLLANRTSTGDEVFEATPLKFDRAEFIKQFNPATNVEEDVPVVFLLNTADGKSIRLERDKVKDSPYPLATLQDTRPGGQTTQLRSGETLTLDESSIYKLVDVSEENATIEDVASGAKHVIPKAAVPAPQATPEVAQPQ